MHDNYSHKYFNESSGRFESVTFRTSETYHEITVRKPFSGNKAAQTNFSAYYTLIGKISERNYVVEFRRKDKIPETLFWLRREGIYIANSNLRVFSLKNIRVVNPRNEVILRFPDTYSEQSIKNELSLHGATYISHFATTYLVSCASYLKAKALQKHFNETNFDVVAEFNMNTISQLQSNTKRIPYYEESLFRDKQVHIASLQPQAISTAHQQYKGDKKVKIAIIDDGVYPHHKNLLESFDKLLSYDAIYDQADQTPCKGDWHGTMCAGIAAASIRNGYGLNGVGAGCSIIGVRIFEKKHTNLFTILRAFHYAAFIALADVISCSFIFSFRSELVRILLKEIYDKGGATNRGTSIVMAAGNDGGFVTFPNTLKEVLTVGGVNKRLRPLHIPGAVSNKGAAVNVSAIGDKVLTLDLPLQEHRHDPYQNPENLYDFLYFSGTSASAPQVAGCVGLMLSINYQLTPEEIIDAIEKHVTPFASSRMTGVYGCGTLNILNTLKNIR